VITPGHKAAREWDEGTGMAASLLSIRDLSIDFHTDTGEFRAVDGLSFDVPRDERWRLSANPAPASR
jgi:hypothetical protein